MVKEAEANADADAKRKEEADIRNEADQLSFQADKAVEEEKPAFIERIVAALELMIERTRKERKLPQELLEEVERHSWKKKIETIYNLL